jgi:hypothetical protein
MSEEFFNQIADELRSSQTSPAAPIVEVPEEKIETASEPTEVVNNQITESPKEEVAVKEWWDNESTVTQKAETAKTEEPQFDLDEDVKLIMEYKKSGKSLADFVKEYKVEDYSAWNDEQIVKSGLKEFMNLSDEELEQATYEFESASILQKKQWAEDFRQKFESKNENKLKELKSSNNQNSQYQEAVASKYNEELTNFSQEIVGKEVYGLKVTDEMSKDLKNFIDTEFTLQRQDGSFDVEKMYSIGLWLKYGKDLVKANITKARNEGKEQVIREVSNPSKNMTGGGRSVGSGLEAAQEAFIAMFPG